MSEPDPAPAPAADPQPPEHTPDKRRPRSAKKVRTRSKIRERDRTDERRKSRKKVLLILRWVGLWILALAAIWFGLTLFVKNPRMVVE